MHAVWCVVDRTVLLCGEVQCMLMTGKFSFTEKQSVWYVVFSSVWRSTLSVAEGTDLLWGQVHCVFRNGTALLH